ncbi:heme-binding protein [Candidatus Uhrbacteria bacterium]|nr:heme-binding protein [Candidatus Uhrbacteria bacterium]
MARKKKTAANASGSTWTSFAEFEQADTFNVRVTREAMTREALILLGRFIADAIFSAKQKLSVTVWTANGQRLFSQAGEGTTCNNDLFLRRKFRTVQHFGMSTMGLHLKLAEAKQSLVTRYSLSESEFATCDGGIPIYVNDLMVAIVTVSGLPLEKDHRELVRMLHEFFNDKEE